MPRATIALLNWNGGDFVRPCVESILRQNEQDFEVVVVDNHSEDGSVDVIETLLSDSMVRHEVVRLDENRGICGGLQVALKRAGGKYFFPFASDDEMLWDRVQRQCDQLDGAGPSTHIAAGAVALIGPDGTPIRNRIGRPMTLRPPRYDRMDRLAKAWKVPPAPGMAFRTDGLRSIGGYDSSAPVEDIDTFMRLVLLGGSEVVATCEVVSRYRRHASNSSRDSELTGNGLEHTLRTLFESGVDFGDAGAGWIEYLDARSRGYKSPWGHLLGALATSPLERSEIRTAGRDVMKSSMSTGRRLKAGIAYVAPTIAARWVRRQNPK